MVALLKLTNAGKHSVAPRDFSTVRGYFGCRPPIRSTRLMSALKNSSPSRRLLCSALLLPMGSLAAGSSA